MITITCLIGVAVLDVLTCCAAAAGAAAVMAATPVTTDAVRLAMPNAIPVFARLIRGFLSLRFPRRPPARLPRTPAACQPRASAAWPPGELVAACAPRLLHVARVVKTPGMAEGNRCQPGYLTAVTLMTGTCGRRRAWGREPCS